MKFVNENLKSLILIKTMAGTNIFQIFKHDYKKKNSPKKVGKKLTLELVHYEVLQL